MTAPLRPRPVGAPRWRLGGRTIHAQPVTGKAWDPNRPRAATGTGASAGTAGPAPRRAAADPRRRSATAATDPRRAAAPDPRRSAAAGPAPRRAATDPRRSTTADPRRAAADPRRPSAASGFRRAPAAPPTSRRAPAPPPEPRRVPARRPAAATTNRRPVEDPRRAPAIPPRRPAPAPSHGGRAIRGSGGALAVQAEHWYGEPAERPQPRRSKPRLHVVPDQKAARRRRLSGLATGGVLVTVFLGLFCVVILHVLLAQGQDDVQDLQTRVAAEQERQQELRLEVERRQAPAQVVAEAKARGMVVPTTVIALKAASLEAPPATIIPVPTTRPAPTTTAASTATTAATRR